jgi:hypothetical protein
LAALLYAPNKVTAFVADGKEVTITEETSYPFSETIAFKIKTKEDISFPIHLRIPGWCKKGSVEINNEPFDTYPGGQIVAISRTWSDGDVIELKLPMHIFTSRWYEQSAAVERGPLVYALKIEEEWKWVENKDKYGSYYDVFPKSDWNYGLDIRAILDPEEGFQVIQHRLKEYPWNIHSAPVELKTKAKKIPEWKLYNTMPGPLPHSGPQRHLQEMPFEEISLIPYGCTTLRITEFPLVQ